MSSLAAAFKNRKITVTTEQRRYLDRSCFIRNLQLVCLASMNKGNGPNTISSMEAARKGVTQLINSDKVVSKSRDLKIYAYGLVHHWWTWCSFYILPEGSESTFGGVEQYMPREYIDAVEAEIRFHRFIKRQREKQILSEFPVSLVVG